MSITLATLFVVLAALYTVAGSFLYRIRGAGFEPELLEWTGFSNLHAKFVCSVWLVLPLLGVVDFGDWREWAIFAAAAVLTQVLVRTGHGDYLDLGSRQDQGDPTELWARFIDRFLPRNEDGAGTVLHDFIGMFLSGATNMAAVGLAFGILTELWVAAPFILLCGVVKAVSYWAGWWVLFKQRIRVPGAPEGSQWGEFLTGAGYSLVSMATLAWAVYGGGA